MLNNNQRNVSLWPAKVVPSAYELWKLCLSRVAREQLKQSHIWDEDAQHKEFCVAPTFRLSKSNPRAAVNMPTFKLLQVMPSDSQTSLLRYMRPASKFSPFLTM